MSEFSEDGRYPGEVVEARLVDGKNHTGLYIRVNCEGAGSIAKIYWFTPAALKMARSALTNLGLTEDQLCSEEFWDQIEGWVMGKKCSIVPELEDDGNGGNRWAIKFLNAAFRPVKPGATKDIASMFRRTAPAAEVGGGDGNPNYGRQVRR